MAADTPLDPAAVRVAVPALIDVADAAAGLLAFASHRNEPQGWPWWGWTSEEDGSAGCIGCLGNDDDMPERVGQTDDWSLFPHEPDCRAARLDAALARLAGEANDGR